VDQEGPDHEGCSHGNAGLIVPSHFIPLAAPGLFKLALRWMWNPESPFYIKPRLQPELVAWGWRFWRAANWARVERAAPLLRDLNLASRAGFEELADLESNDFGLVRRGLLMLCQTPQALDEEAKTAEMATRLGLPAQVLSAQQAAELDPGTSLDITGAVYFPRDCHLSPERFLDRMRHHLKVAGAHFHWSTRVEGFSADGHRITAVHAGEQTIEADEVVVCGGAWSARLGQSLGLRLLLQAGKGYSVTLKHPRELPGICSILTEARVAVTPMSGNLRVAGTMEIAGLNEKLNPRRVHGILKSLPRYYPAFRGQDFEGIRPWVGLRPVSPDGLPYLGRTARWSNVTIATGHAMMGLSLAPITGKLVAQLLEGERPSIDLSLLSPDRAS
jgi:D-amino-acid dehydrogenase